MNIEKDSLRSSPFGTDQWEEEGQSKAMPPLPKDLPEGITASWTIEYLVGPYRYNSLTDATAELRRSNHDSARPKSS